MIADVYNMDNPVARSIFSRVPKSEILEMQMVCVASVDVYTEDESRSWAYFDEEATHIGGMHKPYMVINGVVSELHLDDDDPREFPSGARSLVIKSFNKDNYDETDPIAVKVNWRLTADEIAYLYSVGLGNDSFAPPDILKGNRIDIPVNIIYKAIYNTPITAVKIVMPSKIETSTKFNRYDTLFMNEAVAPEIVSEKENGGVDIEFNMLDYEKYPTYENLFSEMEAEDSYNINIGDDELIVGNDETNTEPTYTEEEKHDMEFNESISQKMDSSIQNDIAEQEAQKKDKFDVNSILDDMSKEAKSDKTQASGSLRLSDRLARLKAKTDNMSGTNEQGKENETIVTDIANGEQIDENLTAVEKDHKKAEKDAEKRRQQIMNIDRAMDNKALNEGKTDISGFGASDDKPAGNDKRSSLTQRLLSSARGNKQADTNDKPSTSNPDSRFL